MIVGLLGEGSSDSLLIPPIRWLLSDLDSTREFRIEQIDLRVLRHPPRSLDERIAAACREAPRNLLLVHRDADASNARRRYDEIDRAVEKASAKEPAVVNVAIVPVVPVRMTEAWLLIDEAAIRKAARSAGSRVSLDMPSIGAIETLPDPKRHLDDLLLAASETTGRRRRRFRPERSRHDIAAFIEDWHALDDLVAFRELRTRLAAVLERP